MYTRCPACRSEIAFEPPANMASLPDDYKHRIKCPSCGVTIGVKLNKIERQPVRNDYADLQPLEEISEPSQQVVTVPERSVAKKSTGAGKNAILMIISLLVLAYNVVGFLFLEGIIPFDDEDKLMQIYFNVVNVYGVYGNGIMAIYNLIRSPGSILSAFAGVQEFLIVLSSLLSCLMVIMAFVTFLVSFISLCAKNYNARVFYAVWSVLFFVLYAFSVFGCLLIDWEWDEGVTLADKFLALGYMSYAMVGLSLLQMILALCFVKSPKGTSAKAKKK